MRTRFAPSPTGHLHLGHLFAAKIAHDLAGSVQKGSFFLRFEDIDRERCRPEYVSSILSDLEFFELGHGLSPLFQSQRMEAYQAALKRIIAAGLAYPCFCTRKEIREELARIQTAPHAEPNSTYPGICRRMDPSIAKSNIDKGMPHSWRLNSQQTSVSTGPLEFSEVNLPLAKVSPELNGDVILSRKNIGVSYHLAVVVDDAFQDITHVTRGEDLRPATHTHRQLQAILQLPTPIYFHHPLLVDSTGKRLAKSSSSSTIQELRRQGLSPQQILAQLPPLPNPLAPSSPAE